MAFDEIYEGAIAEDSKGPKKLFRQAVDGAIIALSYAEILLNSAIKNYGEEAEISYPNTGYQLPVIRALSGEEVTKLKQLPPILNRMRNQVEIDTLTFENARLAGESTLYAAEIIEALRYLKGKDLHVQPWTGFLQDPVFRQYGINMVDWTIPGEAVILGRAKSSKKALQLIDDLQGKGFMLFLCDEIIEQLLEEGARLGIDYIAYPLGNFTQVVHAVNYALRAGMAFGGITPGDREAQRDYQRRRIRAFVLHLGERDEVKTAAEFGAIFLGFPVLTDQELDEDEMIPDWYFSVPDYDEIVKTAIEVRGIEITDIEIDAPITVGVAFEGEVIRRDDTYAEFGGGRSKAFELVRMADKSEIEDGKIEVIGPELDDVEPGSRVPLGIMVDIYGRKMQSDFEPVLERRIHDFINYGKGIWHAGQRDINWLRISKEAQEAGFKIKHFGEILYAKFMSEFSSIVDRIQITFYTEEDKVLELRDKFARPRYEERDERIAGLTDEAVDEFYSCTLCQSFAPDHVCVVAPERLGLCGAVNWLDGKAAYEINPKGGNQPIEKGEELDAVKGSFSGVNKFVYEATNYKLEKVNMYSMMEDPMTSCGCFEAIMAIVPEANGVMIVNREYDGDTPIGMTFSTLAGSVGGGVQTPGFMGIGRRYVASKKFIAAEGGIARIVWLPKEVKEFLKDDIIERAEEEGLEDFYNKIADETVGTSVEEILPFLQENDHPALSMEPMM